MNYSITLINNHPYLRIKINDEYSEYRVYGVDTDEPYVKVPYCGDVKLSEVNYCLIEELKQYGFTARKQKRQKAATPVKQPTNNMEKARHAHTNYNALKPFINACVSSEEGHVRILSDGYMPLVIERLYYSDCYGNPVYSIAHTGTMNGDLMFDPEITFSVNDETERVIPLTFRNDYIGTYQEVCIERNGKTLYNHSLLVDLDAFFRQWLKNIKDQGFLESIA